MKVIIPVHVPLARQALVFAQSLRPADADCEYLCDADIPVPMPKDRRRTARLPCVPFRGGGRVEVVYDGNEIAVEVRSAEAPKDKEEVLVLDISAADRGVVDDFLDRASEHCSEAVSAPVVSKHRKMRRFVFDHGYWEKISENLPRDPGSVFMTEEAKRVSDKIVEFVTNKAVRDRFKAFGVTHKLNVLLYGPPGTGKTSFIDSVASRLGSDIYIMQFSMKMRDDDLVVAMRRADGHRPVIIMEDIDSLFAERKKLDAGRNSITLSGILNCLDGMSRPEGSVVFLTTNDPSCLDAAVTRSRRVDHSLELGYATPKQTRAMTYALVPSISEEDLSRFVSSCEGRTYTTADLHSYLFNMSEMENPSWRGLSSHISSHKFTDPGASVYHHLYI